jgi:glycerate 2-kinase
MTSIEPREFLTQVYRAGVAAANPRRATRQAVDAIPILMPDVWLFAVGKGAHGMASGALDALRARGASVIGGLVVANAPDDFATHGLEALEGDHPTPGARSLAAAERLTALLAETTPDSDAIVLVSGGATSLIAAPVPGVSESELRDTFSALLASGADISLMNAIRKRVLRFGAGRLAIALGSRTVHCLIASDVIGNDTAAIASGPCVPDRTSAHDARARAIAAGAWDSLPQNVREQLDNMANRRALDVPPPDHPRFASTSVHVILDRSDAERGAEDAARQLGALVTVFTTPLTGDAANAGCEFAGEVLRRERIGTECIIWSGEPTVKLDGAAGTGGRCQEFALACAESLEAAGADANGITVLAAGTDGRDGPTDAAGAIVDSRTFSDIRNRGYDPTLALQRHDSYHALDSVGALLKTGPSGTNVNDLVVAVITENT